jgi:hypothetical protein
LAVLRPLALCRLDADVEREGAAFGFAVFVGEGLEPDNVTPVGQIRLQANEEATPVIVIYSSIAHAHNPPGLVRHGDRVRSALSPHILRRKNLHKGRAARQHLTGRGIRSLERGVGAGRRRERHQQQGNQYECVK